MNRTVFNIFHIVRRNAGHSKWQNIRHTKSEKDTQRSVLLSRLCQRIRIACKENGNNSNPISNPQLAQAIEIAKGYQMPNSTLQSCLKSLQGDADATQPYRYSIKGPRGTMVIATALTSSVKKTKQELQFILKRAGGIMAEQSFENNFDKKGVLIAVPPEDMEDVEETSVDHAIECGAEEVSRTDDKLTFYTEMKALHQVRDKLKELGYTIEETKITLIPKITVSLNDGEMELMSKVISKIEEHPDVVEIYDNIR